MVLHWVDGLRLAEGLKQHPLTRNTQVVVMSGLNRTHVRQRALDAGAEAFLPKPVDPERLLRLLTGHVPTPDAVEPDARPTVSDEALGSDRYAS